MDGEVRWIRSSQGHGHHKSVSCLCAPACVCTTHTWFVLYAPNFSLAVGSLVFSVSVVPPALPLPRLLRSSVFPTLPSPALSMLLSPALMSCVSEGTVVMAAAGIPVTPCVAFTTSSSTFNEVGDCGGQGKGTRGRDKGQGNGFQSLAYGIAGVARGWVGENGGSADVGWRINLWTGRVHP